MDVKGGDENTLNSIKILQIQVERERKARERAEALLHGHTKRILETNKELEQLTQSLEQQVFIKGKELLTAQRIGGFGTFVWDIDKQFVSWSETFYQVIGLDPEGTLLTYERFLDVLHEDERQAFDTYFRAQNSQEMEDGQTYTAQHRVVWPNGEVRRIDGFAEVIHDAQRGTRTLFGAIQDVTEKKLVGDALEVSGKIITKRVQELEEAKGLLGIARDEAEVAHQAKIRFLALMSEKISPPLNKLLTSLDVLRDSKMDQTESVALSDTVKAAGSLSHLLNNVIELATLEHSPDAQINEAPFNFLELIENVCATSRPMAERKGLRFEHNTNLPSAEHIVGDAQKIRQILHILITNAIEYTREGKITVSLDLHQRQRLTDGQETLIELAVSDTGCGIAPDDQDHIFDEFVKLAPESDTQGEGSGLGLSICKKLVERLNGTLGVESEPGVGSRFWCVLPLVLDAAPSTEQKNSRRLDEIETETEKPPKILLAEDNLANQMVAAKMLEGFGCQVDVVENGKEAINAVVGQDYDLILMDVSMPEMDGLTATKRIRDRTDAKANVPIVGFTAFVFADDIQRCLDAGMNEVVSKPLFREELHDAIQVALVEG